jgi:predicted naringenin-chalcone synthase
MEMTDTLKSNEALSNGHIFDPKKKQKESETIQEQIEAFIKSGGNITK